MPQRKSKPIDRLPIICAAGKKASLSESVAEVFREYSQEDFAENLVKAKEKLNKYKPIESVSPILPENNRLKDILAPYVNKSRFLEFKDQFYENLYCKRAPLGKPTPAHSKPEHITNESVTFGKINEKSEKAYDIVLPKRSPKEVLKEFVKWHDKYRLSHGNYFPSEQITRGYNNNFDRNQVFGEKTRVDITGKQVKSILHGSTCSPKAENEQIEQHKSLVGKPIRRQNHDLHPDTIFGRQTRAGDFNVKNLLSCPLTPEEVLKYTNETTYRLFAKDLENSVIECKSPAGRIESLYPRKGDCKFFAENLGDETTVKQLISPSIPSQFGLTHRDFLLPRSKEDVRRIFSNAGIDLSDDEYFEKVWSIALAQWTAIGDLVSVEAFKYALDKLKNK